MSIVSKGLQQQKSAESMQKLRMLRNKAIGEKPANP